MEKVKVEPSASTAKACSESVRKFSYRINRANGSIPSSKNTTSRAHSVKSYAILEARREERASFQRGQTRKFGLLDCSHRGARGDQLRKDIVAAARMPQATNVPREKRQRFRQHGTLAGTK